jgi:hypothetical protein
MHPARFPSLGSGHFCAFLRVFAFSLQMQHESAQIGPVPNMNEKD